MNSPFKLLDAYTGKDTDIFFGRDKDIEALYKLCFQSRLMLLYGQSGTGKSSLIQCGLSKKFSPVSWLPLYIRRRDDFNYSFRQELTACVKDITHDMPIGEAVRTVYKEYLRPVYLIFDQFEEIFILGNKYEQDIFADTLNEILKEEIPCKIILTMREEYIGYLYGFEKKIPGILDKRLRVEAMSDETIKEVIEKTCKSLGIQLENDYIPYSIIQNLKPQENNSRGMRNNTASNVVIQLPHLQIYLHYLYVTAIERISEKTGLSPKNISTSQIVFSEELIQNQGNIEQVMGFFIETQSEEIQQMLEVEFNTEDSQPVPQQFVRKVLNEFATSEGTKNPTRLNWFLEVLQRPHEIVMRTLNLLVYRAKLLRTDGNAKDIYEPVHDIITKQIHARRTQGEKDLAVAQKLIQTAYNAYETNKFHPDKLLTPSDISFIEPFERILKEEDRLSGTLWDYIATSKEAIRQEALEKELQLKHEQELRAQAEAQAKRAEEQAKLAESERLVAKNAEKDAAEKAIIAMEQFEKAKRNQRIAFGFIGLCVLLLGISGVLLYMTKRARDKQALIAYSLKTAQQSIEEKNKALISTEKQLQLRDSLCQLQLGTLAINEIGAVKKGSVSPTPVIDPIKSTVNPLSNPTQDTAQAITGRKSQKEVTESDMNEVFLPQTGKTLYAIVVGTDASLASAKGNINIVKQAFYIKEKNKVFTVLTYRSLEAAIAHLPIVRKMMLKAKVNTKPYVYTFPNVVKVEDKVYESAL